MAVEKLHTMGITHGNVSPQTILIDQRTGRAALEIAGPDPGEDEYNQHYRAPEQQAGKPSTQEMDNWACGVVIMELLMQKQYLFANRADAQNFQGREDDLKQKIQEYNGRCPSPRDLEVVLALLLPRQPGEV